jgi:hypothetical protein
MFNNDNTLSAGNGMRSSFGKSTDNSHAAAIDETVCTNSCS